MLKKLHFSLGMASLTGSPPGYSKQKKILSGIHLVDAGERARESVGSSLTMLEDDCQSVRCDHHIIINTILIITTIIIILIEKVLEEVRLCGKLRVPITFLGRESVSQRRDRLA